MKSLLEAYAQMKSDTKLKGDQHKLDKNKNGKLDSDDFKKLRKEEQDPPFAGPYTTVKNNKNNGAQKARALAQKALKTAIIKGTEKYTSSPDKLKPKHFGMAEQFTEGYEEIKVHSKDGKHIGTITHGKYQSVAYAHPTTKFGGSKVPHPDEDSTTLAGPHETQKGIDYIHAHHRMVSEEVELDEEQLDEWGPSFHDRMINTKAIIDKQKAKALAAKGATPSKLKPKKTVEEVEFTLEDYSVAELEEFMQTEEYEQLDELSKSTLGSYVKKAAADATISRKVASDFEHMSARAKKPSMKASASELEKEYKSKSWKRRDNIGKAVDRLTKEEFEQIEEGEEKIKYVSGHGWGPGRVQVTTNKGRKMMVKHEITKDHSYTGPQVGHKMSDWEHMKEEVELDEAADNNPNHGRMTFAYTDQVGPHTDVDHLHVKQVGIGARAQAGKGANMHLANYVSSKGGDGHKETSEKFKHVIRSAYNSSGGDPKKVLAAIKSHDPGRSSRWSLHSHIKEEHMKTFKEFIEEAHEYKAGRYVHKGTYGTSHDDPGVKSKPFWQSADKDEDDKPKKADAPAVKRGRGRPAGAKSGARQFGAAAKDGSGADYTGMKLHLPNSNR